MSCITRDNFEDYFCRIVDAIKSSSFIAIDLEMSGINSYDKGQRMRKDDSPEIRYSKMTGVATKYAIIQVGICCFCPDECKSGKFVAHPFSFFIFPESGSDVVLSPSSIDFLRKNGMDFNKWISKGIAFANEREEEYLRTKYNIPSNADTINKEDEKSSLDSLPANTVAQPPVQKAIVLTKPDDVQFMDRQIAGLNAMLQSESQTEFVFEYANAFLRKAIFQYMATNHPEVAMIKNSDGKQCAKKMNNSEKQQHDQQSQVDNLKAFQSAMGFKRIWNEVIASKKPVVGHNCLYDLLFLSRWLDRPLPQSFTQFKERLNQMFPKIYDTKFIAASGILGQKYEESTLSVLYEMWITPRSKQETSQDLAISPVTGDGIESSVVEVSFAEGLDMYGEASAQQYHEAGYDAYCTGRIFAHTAMRLGGWSATREVAENRLFLTQSLYHLDLDPCRPHGWLKFEGAIIHICGFLPSTVTEDLFVPFTSAGVGLARSQLEALWLDDRNALMAVGGAVDSAETLIAQLPVPDGWELQSFQQYTESSVQGNEQLTSSGPSAAVGVSAVGAVAAEQPVSTTESVEESTRKKRKTED